MELIWKELGSKFNELLELGKPGVVALMLAASERLQTHLQEVFPHFLSFLNFRAHTYNLQYSIFFISVIGFL